MFLHRAPFKHSADQSGTFLPVVQHAAPAVNNHRATPSAAAIFMKSALRRRNDKSLVFDGSSTNQCFPMGLSRRVGERAWNEQKVGRQKSVKLREAKVIANA